MSKRDYKKYERYKKSYDIFSLEKKSATTLFSKKREMNEDTVRKDAAQQKNMLPC